MGMYGNIKYNNVMICALYLQVKQVPQNLWNTSKKKKRKEKKRKEKKTKQNKTKQNKTKQNKTKQIIK